MLSAKAREAADTIFKVFGMTQLRITFTVPGDPQKTGPLFQLL